MPSQLSPEVLLTAYAHGMFPMADENRRIIWLAPDPRTIIELEAFHTPRTLRTVLAGNTFSVTVNRCFEDVIRACADRAESTWISPEIIEAYTRLNRLGYAHSVEAWQADTLAGGLYGVTIGGAFFGESMFHRVSNASKVALVRLVERLRQRRFVLLDTQFSTPHLRRFGAIDISRKLYQRRLQAALRLPCVFTDDAPASAYLPSFAAIDLPNPSDD